jgi:hypothetical protein
MLRSSSTMSDSWHRCLLACIAAICRAGSSSETAAKRPSTPRCRRGLRYSAPGALFVGRPTLRSHRAPDAPSSLPTRRNGSGSFSLARHDAGRVLRYPGDASEVFGRPSCRCGEATPSSPRSPLGFLRPVQPCQPPRGGDSLVAFGPSCSQHAPFWNVYLGLGLVEGVAPSVLVCSQHAPFWNVYLGLGLVEGVAPSVLVPTIVIGESQVNDGKAEQPDSLARTMRLIGRTRTIQTLLPVRLRIRHFAIL